MFDIAFTELALVLLAAVIVIRPRDWPMLARTLGNWWGRARLWLQHWQQLLQQELNQPTPPASPPPHDPKP